MIHLPQEFVTTKFPGYFWNLKEQKLYSIKVSGLLKPLTFSPRRWTPNGIMDAGYRVSVAGRRRFLPQYYLEKLRPMKRDVEIGYAK